MTMGLMKAKPTIENYRLREAFDNWPAGSIVRVTNAAAWSGFRALRAERVSDDATFNFEFDAAFHAQIEQIRNRPPMPREAMITREDVIRDVFDGDEGRYDVAQKFGFPKPAGSVMTSQGNYLAALTSAFWPREINDWLSGVRALAAGTPKRI